MTAAFHPATPPFCATVRRDGSAEANRAPGAGEGSLAKQVANLALSTGLLLFHDQDKAPHAATVQHAI